MLVLYKALNYCFTFEGNVKYMGRIGKSNEFRTMGWKWKISVSYEIDNVVKKHMFVVEHLETRDLQIFDPGNNIVNIWTHVFSYRTRPSVNISEFKFFSPFWHHFHHSSQTLKSSQIMNNVTLLHIWKGYDLSQCPRLLQHTLNYKLADNFP